ncbi:MAG: hypothetical protein AB1813_10380, partial [Verrucomicrobiota bacterium]
MSHESSSPPTPPSKSVTFLRRLLSSVILWTIVIASLFATNRIVSNYVFLVIMMVLAGVGLIEFYDLVGKRGLVCFKGWGVFGGLLLMATTFSYLSGLFGPVRSPAAANDFETSLLIGFVLGLCV